MIFRVALLSRRPFITSTKPFPPTAPSRNQTKKPSNISGIFVKAAVIAGITTLSLITYNSYKSSQPKTESPVMRTLPKVEFLKSMDEITQIFKKNEKSLNYSTSKEDFTFDLNSVPSNNPMEDYHSQHKSKYGMIYGVFDGHGGWECAATVSKLLACYIDRKLANAPLAPNGLPEKSAVIKSLKEAFVELDKDICYGSIQLDPPSSPSTFYSLWNFNFTGSKNSISPADYKMILKGLRTAASGSCAIVAYLQGDEVYVANTGDCRAVMGRNMGYADQYSAIDLSKDQTAKSPTEFSRMCEEHPGEDATIVVRGRVLGGLMPSRAFGDARYKWPVSIQEIVNPHMGRRIPPNLLTPPYVTAEPEVTFYQRDKADEFLIIACDGLWDEMSSDTSVKVVKELTTKGYAGNYATALIQAGISGYGAGGTLLDAARIQHSLSIPSPQSRRYRDDMTVGVLFLGARLDNSASKHLAPVPVAPAAVSPKIYDWVAILKNSKMQQSIPVKSKTPKAKL